jgi:branched-chain amino acid transport system substrate-binding protein
MTENTRRSGRRAIRAPLVAILLVIALIAAACGDSDDGDDAGGGGGESTTTAAGGGGGGAFEINTDDCDTDPESVTVEGDTIKLGTSLPQSGIYTTFQEILKGQQAYLEYVNTELGGVEIAGKKYQIELVDKDDAYEASRTVTNVRSLLDSDNVFALFNVVGTKNNAAIRIDVNDACVPSLFAATGSPLWGNHDFPWIVGTFLVPYPLEMMALVDYLKVEKPDATIAVLRANDDFGRSYLETLETLIEGTQLTIKQVETYDPENPETRTQITSLAASDADVFVLAATLLACPTSLNAIPDAWQPIIYMSGTCTSKTLMSAGGARADGVLSVAPLMDPNDPANANNPAMQLYKEKVAQYQPSADIGNGIVAYGWTAGAMLVKTLEESPAVNRLAVMETARALENIENIGLQLPGTTWSVNGDDWFFGEQFTMVQYSTADAFFSPVGEIIKADDQTEEITPEALINSE